MGAGDKKRAAQRAPVDRLLNGDGAASRELRASAFANAGLPPTIDALVGKVATAPTEVSETDLAAAQAAGAGYLLKRGYK